ncbi:uncharacterized protein PAN0_001d0227 [Moesziomyces antarcticus]|uniref:Uncharacterized protein n=1 Tax=Pseudozyma antarctica TaxID=84753 RepID=A0A5C3FDU4_PSEA2|nr:uncharacterized protein PAN0_001d0227 [Moesziomyces antarcticus]GAK62030.1 conserved hypothetical protein [Moesziomyces antarcticus]SPO42558.1 uncharacterized protein PSANT_00241 [Moesziomyces antarcticus]
MSARKPRSDAARGGIDTFSSPCYTIPWQPKKKAKRASSKAALDDSSEPPFPILAEFEADSDPAYVRYNSYCIAVQRTEALFEKCMDLVYTPLFEDLKSFFHTDSGSSNPNAHPVLAGTAIANQDLFLPGFETLRSDNHGTVHQDGPSSSIQTALLISTSAPSLSSFSGRLVSEISDASNDGAQSIVVTLSASECSNLYTALRLVVARFIAQGSTMPAHPASDAHAPSLAEIEAAAFAGKVEPDLHVLALWWSRKFGSSHRAPRLVVNLPMIESIEPTVLSDLLSSLQTFVAEPCKTASASTDPADSPPSRPQLLLVLGITSPSGGLAAASAGTSANAAATAAPAPWIEFIPRQVLRVLDISRFSLPSKEIVWSRLVQSFLTSRELPLSLGASTFEYIRETYWERDADLDAVLDAVRLACFMHFSGKPESVFTIPGEASKIRFFSWTPKMVERIKIAFLTTAESGDLVLPLLGASSGSSDLDVDEFLQEAARSDQFILGKLDQLHHPRDLLCYRIEFAIRFLSRAFEALQRIQNQANTAAQAMHARTLTAASQQAAEIDEQRQLERASEILTQVVMQCLNASVGSLEADHRPPAILTLRNGLARLCNAARRLLSDEFETLLDDMVGAAEDEARAIEDSVAESIDMAESDHAGQSRQLRTASEAIAAHSAKFLAGMRTFQQRLSQTLAAGSAGVEEDDDADVGAASASGGASAQAAKQRREARLQRVQRKLLMEEKLLGLKREITDWIVASVQELVDWRQIGRELSGLDNGPLQLLKDIFWVDCYGPLSTLLDPSTRAGVTLPLTAPGEFVESLYDAALSVVPEEELDDIDIEGLQSSQTPDVCRLYKLYGECGKFVNLADWFDAFKQTVQSDEATRTGKQDLAREQSATDSTANQGEANVDANEVDTPSTPSKRRSPSKRTVQLADADEYDPDLLDTPSRKRSRFAEPIQPDDEAEEAPGSETDLQCRFALALNQLARMGMIRGTKRRNEHITKVLWDLVPDTF